MFRLSMIANFVLVVVLAQSDNESTCTIQNGLKLCTNRGVLTEVTEQTSEAAISLALDNTGLVSIKLGAFKNLSIVYLTLSGPRNQISTLEPGVFAGVPQLNVLDLRRNAVKLVPNLFQELFQLDSLVLSGNHIDQIPDGTFNGLSNLKYLQLNLNNISAISKTTFDGLSKLEVLELAGNVIESIAPEAFASLPRLRSLDLATNNLTEIPPNTFRALSELKSLEISSNKITRLDSNTFVGLGKLTYLRLENNEISHLEAGAFHGLSSVNHISLTNNKFRALPNGLFAGLPALGTLYMDGDAWDENNPTDLQLANSVNVRTD